MLPREASSIAPTSARSVASIDTPSITRLTTRAWPLRSLICQSTAIACCPGRTTRVCTSTPARPPSLAPVTSIRALRYSSNCAPYLRDR